MQIILLLSRNKLKLFKRFFVLFVFNMHNFQAHNNEVIYETFQVIWKQFHRAFKSIVQWNPRRT